MVTIWQDHWQDGQVTFYPEDLIYVNPDLPQPAPTLFIRRNNQSEIGQVVRGKVSEIHTVGGKTFFRVHIEEEVPSSDSDWQIARELNKSGWYCEWNYEPSNTNRSFVYILSSNFAGYWEYVERSRYNREMISAEPLQPNTPAIFIRYREDSSTPQGWLGEIRNLSESAGIVYFTITLHGEATEDEVRRACQAVRGRQTGWHVYQSVVTPQASTQIHDWLQIPFLKALLDEQISPESFEKLCYWLLRLLGIHNLHTVERQAGHWDGFFVFGNLVVIYDATLQRDFEQAKAQQMENYVRKLRSGFVEWRDANGVLNTFSVGDKEKQVWILTRGRSRLIGHHDDVLVKEVYVEDLVKLFYDRVLEGMSQRDLEDALRRVGEHGGG